MTTNVNFPEIPSHLEALRILAQGDRDFVRRLAHHALIAEQLKARAGDWVKAPFGLIEHKDPAGQCAVCESVWMYSAHLAAHLEHAHSDPIGVVLQETALTIASFSNSNPPHDVAFHLSLVY